MTPTHPDGSVADPASRQPSHPVGYAIDPRYHLTI
jgi:hypothetical protein